MELFEYLIRESDPPPRQLQTLPKIILPSSSLFHQIKKSWGNPFSVVRPNLGRPWAGLGADWNLSKFIFHLILYLKVNTILTTLFGGVEEARVALHGWCFFRVKIGRRAIPDGKFRK